MNCYWNDAQRFLCRVPPLICEKMEDDSIIDACLFFAIGIERMLKAILFDINPLFILQNPDYSNSAPLLYGTKVKGKADKKQFADKPNADVLTIGNSLFRAHPFSESVTLHRGDLHRLSNFRDIIVHCSLAEHTISDWGNFVALNFVPIVNDVLLEHNFDFCDFLRVDVSTRQRLEQVSENVKNKLNIETRVRAEVAEKRNIWQSRCTDTVFIERVTAATRTKLRSEPENGNYFADVRCPACQQYALVEIEPDYDWCDHENIQIGATPVAIECQYCTLSMKDYLELKAIGVQSLLTSAEHMLDF